eukprot:TRINITY_DN2634_c0_g1_i1.p1 TRINITY_DN2634_c0_g1~~TRINITY_DN2634_c0_g1_i1.p1  ORF type:complete len:242 (-),score=36.67 TRINITY_DN2634_c0_g1_i1:190-873(-)
MGQHLRQKCVKTISSLGVRTRRDGNLPRTRNASKRSRISPHKYESWRKMSYRMPQGYGYTDRYRPKELAEDEFPLMFEVEITYSAKEFKGDEGVQVRIECAERKKARGNELLKKKRLETALKHYEHALELSRLKEKVDSEHRNKLDLLVLLSLLNLAAVQLKLKNYVEVKKRCTSALLLDKKNCKALYRRAQAHRLTGDFFDAKEDILKCIKYMPDDQKNLESPSWS